MFKIKNITNENIVLPYVGIKLAQGEIRDVIEFSDRSSLVKNSSALEADIINDKIIFLLEDRVLSKDESISFVKSTDLFSTINTSLDFLPTGTDDNQILKTNSNNEWVTVKADDPVEGLTVIALPYYWDEVRQKYLDNQLLRVVFYENGDSRRRRYLNYIPEIRSNDIPFRIYDNETYCLVNAEYHTENEATGVVMEIRDIADNNRTLGSVNLGDVPTSNFFIDSVDINLTEGMDVAAYITNTRLDNPTLVLGLRKIWTP